MQSIANICVRHITRGDETDRLPLSDCFIFLLISLLSSSDAADNANVSRLLLPSSADDDVTHKAFIDFRFSTVTSGGDYNSSGDVIYTGTSSRDSCDVTVPHVIEMTSRRRVPPPQLTTSNFTSGDRRDVTVDDYITCVNSDSDVTLRGSRDRRMLWCDRLSRFKCDEMLKCDGDEDPDDGVVENDYCTMDGLVAKDVTAVDSESNVLGAGSHFRTRDVGQCGGLPSRLSHLDLLLQSPSSQPPPTPASLS